MNLTLAALILEAGLKWGPAAARALIEIFGKTEITVADWEKVFASIDKSYDEYVAPKK